MKTSLKGSISVLLIFVVSIVSIFVYYINTINAQNISIIDYNTDFNQAKLMADSYLIVSEDYLRHGIQGSVDLFQEYTHEKNISISEVSIDKIPHYEIQAYISYMNIELSKKSRLTKYNDILFSKLPILEYNLLEEKYRNDFKILRDNFINSPTYDNYSGSVIFPSTESKIGSKGINPELYTYVNGIPKTIRVLNNFNIFIINELTEIGDEAHMGNVNLNGIYFINNNVSLNTNFVLNGIVISNSGSINRNGFSCAINGILIELGSGSYGGIEVKYNKDFILSCLKYLPWSENIERQYIIQTE